MFKIAGNHCNFAQRWPAEVRSGEWNSSHVLWHGTTSIQKEGDIFFLSISRQRESELSSYSFPTVSRKYQNFLLEPYAILEGTWRRKWFLKEIWTFDSLNIWITLKFDYLLKRSFKLEEIMLTLILNLSLPSSLFPASLHIPSLGMQTHQEVVGLEK